MGFCVTVARSVSHSMTCSSRTMSSTWPTLSADLIGLVDDTGQEQAVFVGHDWGALIVWDLIRLHPDRVRGVVGVSVPFIDWPAPPIELFRQRFGDRRGN